MRDGSGSIGRHPSSSQSCCGCSGLMRFLRTPIKSAFATSAAQCAGTMIRSPCRKVRETLRSTLSLRLQNTKPEPPKRPQERRPSVLMTLVDQVLGSQTTERVLLPQLADSVDRFAPGSAGSAYFAGNYLPREHFFDIHFERHPSRLGRCPPADPTPLLQSIKKRALILQMVAENSTCDGTKPSDNGTMTHHSHWRGLSFISASSFASVSNIQPKGGGSPKIITAMSR